MPGSFPLLTALMVISTLIVVIISLGTFYIDLVSLLHTAESVTVTPDGIRKLLTQAAIVAVIATLAAALLASGIYYRSTLPHSRKFAQQAEIFKAITKASHEAILLIDKHGTVLYANPFTTSLFGFARNEILGENIKILMPSSHNEKYNSYTANQLHTGFRKINGFGQQLTAQRKDGSLFPIHLSSAEVGSKHDQLFVALIMDLSTQQKLQREILSLPERERQRIGEELHDGLGQQLTGLSMLAESLLNKASRPEHELAEQLASGLHDALSQVRAMSRGLMPIQIDADAFILSLQEITENIEQQSRIPINLQIDESVCIDDDDTASHLYRIVQESLNNAIKHASASQIIVSLKKEQDHGLLEIIDDGIGMPGDLDHSNGLGLNIMRHRCGMFDGEITINPAGQRGTQVRCRFPISQGKVTG